MANLVKELIAKNEQSYRSSMYPLSSEIKDERVENIEVKQYNPSDDFNRALVQVELDGKEPWIQLRQRPEGEPTKVHLVVLEAQYAYRSIEKGHQKVYALA